VKDNNHLNLRPIFIKATSLAFELASAVFIGAALGYYADKFFNTMPFGLIFGIFLGAVAGFYSIIRFINKNNGTT